MQQDLDLKAGYYRRHPMPNIINSMKNCNMITFSQVNLCCIVNNMYFEKFINNFVSSGNVPIALRIEYVPLWFKLRKVEIVKFNYCKLFI